MIKVTTVDSFGGACPYQLEGRAEDGKEFYLRYRDGTLKYAVMEQFSKWNGVYDFSQKIGDSLDGQPDHEKFCAVLRNLVEFPVGFRHSVNWTTVDKH